jgi:hypothetical protein
MVERRFESRFLCADLVRVKWRAADGGIVSAEGVLEDISCIGGCVQVDEAIPHGMKVELSIGGSVFAGQVRYCVFRDYGYFVGIHFESESAWSEDRVVPRHLTNPCKLARNAS